jgi:hypothetical protein
VAKESEVTREVCEKEKETADGRPWTTILATQFTVLGEIEPTWAN